MHLSEQSQILSMKLADMSDGAKSTSLSFRASFVLIVLCLLALAGEGSAETIHKKSSRNAYFEHAAEWSHWKLKHERNYNSSLEELERHLVWASNKRYIDSHNANSHIFGFTLAMNHLGDVVSCTVYIIYSCRVCA